MKSFLLIPIFLFITVALHAQTAAKKGNTIIHINGYNAWVSHEFYMDILKEGNSVKIKYSYCDSTKYAEIRKDSEYRRLKNISFNYEPGTVKRNLMSDSIGMVIEKHKAFTRDSITLNLKTDTGYRNLLQRITNANNAGLTPKIEQRVLDGYSVFIRIITAEKNLFFVADNPELKTHVLLFSLINQTLNKNKDSDAVQKIRKYYTDF